MGDPACPHCHGLGYVRQELPLGHPDFGRLQACTCRQATIRSQIRERLYSLSQLDELERLTFATFQPRGRPHLPAYNQESLQQAFNLSQTYAHELDGWLLLQGGYGCGKTHLAAAIGNARLDQGDPPLMIMAPDLLDELRAAMNDPGKTSFQRTFTDMRTTPLLILDDLGTQSLTPWARDKMHQLFNHRYNAELPTVITSASTLDEIDERIRARLLDSRLCTIHAITAPAYHGGRRKKK